MKYEAEYLPDQEKKNIDEKFEKQSWQGYHHRRTGKEECCLTDIQEWDIALLQSLLTCTCKTA